MGVRGVCGRVLPLSHRAMLAELEPLVQRAAEAAPPEGDVVMHRVVMLRLTCTDPAGQDTLFGALKFAEMASSR